ncbi:MAG: hypothetical protein ACETVZ_08160 [Phycisphaerae bacterium]
MQGHSEAITVLKREYREVSRWGCGSSEIGRKVIFCDFILRLFKLASGKLLEQLSM